MYLVSLLITIFLPSSASFGSPPKTTNLSSISGDCAMISTTSPGRGAIKVLSNNRDPVYVTSFSGISEDGKKSKRPSINSSTVYQSIFNGDVFSSVFLDSGEAKFTVFPSKMRKVELTVKDAEKPFRIVRGNISYFWGKGQLPVNSSVPDCVDYLHSNDAGAISYCNVPELDRCSAQIRDIPHLAPFLFRLSNGTQLTEFAWLCPAGTVCCAWECCEQFEESKWEGPLYCTIFVLVFLISCCTACCCGNKQQEANGAGANRKPLPVLRLEVPKMKKSARAPSQASILTQQTFLY